MTILPREEWLADREAYLARISPWVVERLCRRSRHEKHPVHDFLFEYYEFRASHLLRWSPGFEVVLAGAGRRDVNWPDFRETGDGPVLPAAEFPPHRIDYLRWAIDYLRTTGEREPVFGCMGLHEWAMVYRDPAVRHSAMPLRLSRQEIEHAVESLPLRCTHFDAFRFFTPAAVPLNRWQLTRASTTVNDQPGCVHVNMDLYRFAYKIAPYCPSTLLADTFELALRSREIDMQASPYDLTGLGFDALQIETAEGRTEYVELQRTIYEEGRPVRARLLEIYRRLLAAQTIPANPGTGSI